MSEKRIPILMYHSISKPLKGFAMRGLNVPPLKFKIQMYILKFLGYKGVGLNEIIPYLLGEKKGKVVGITFDDGYLDNFNYALPVLKKLNFSATCFIVSNLIGKENIWDKNKGIHIKKLMNKNQIKYWIDSGLEIGSHTKNHVRLSQQNKEVLVEEIRDSKQYLETNFKVNIVSFCYPYGDFSLDVRNIVSNNGYKIATTTKRGLAKKEDDFLLLPRVLVNHRTFVLNFILKILTKYEEKR